MSLYLLAVWYGVNGLWMVAAPCGWYGAIPGVSDTGPTNPHFIRDVGLGFLAAAAALALAAKGRVRRGLIAVALIFLGGHATLHLVEMIGGGFAHGTLRDLVLVVLPTILPALAFKKESVR